MYSWLGSQLKIANADQKQGLQVRLAARDRIDFAEGKLSDETMIDELVPTTLANLENLPIHLN